MKYLPVEKINGNHMEYEKTKPGLTEISIVIPQSQYFQPLKKQSNGIIYYIRKNKYRKGVIHNYGEQEQRVWRVGS